MLELNLPRFDYKVRKKQQRLEIFDAIRRKFIVLTPEEWVRQHFVQYLITELGVPHTHIKLEGGQTYNTLQKRCDIVVWDSNLRPILIVECKASHVDINANVLHQLGNYNSGLQAPFLAVTNGLKHLFFTKTDGKYLPVEGLPHFKEMNLL